MQPHPDPAASDEGRGSVGDFKRGGWEDIKHWAASGAAIQVTFRILEKLLLLLLASQVMRAHAHGGPVTQSSPLVHHENGMLGELTGV